MNTPHVRTLLLALAAACGLASLPARADPPATTAPATAPAAHDPAFFDRLMTHMQLAAEARRDLHALTLADQEKLQQLAAAATDPDIKAEFQSRLEEFDEERALNPAPISIDLKDASFSDMIDALQKAAGTHFDTWPPNGGGGGARSSFTLVAHDQPFWQIFAQLSAQHPMQAYNQSRIQQGRPGMSRCVPLASGFAIFPISITRSNTVDPQRDGSQSEQLQFQYDLAADPRMKLIRTFPVVFKSIRDDAGNDLLGSADRSSSSWSDSNRQCVFPQTISLTLPTKLGKTIASATGEAKFLVQIGEDRVDVDPAKMLNKPISIGNHMATVTQFKIQDRNIQFNVQSSGENGSSEDSLTLAFVDANDQTIWSTRLYGGCGGNTGGNFVEPVKIRFTAPKKTKLLTIPFELKDLPLP